MLQFVATKKAVDTFQKGNIFKIFKCLSEICYIGASKPVWCSGYSDTVKLHDQVSNLYSDKKLTDDHGPVPHAASKDYCGDLFNLPNNPLK